MKNRVATVGTFDGLHRGHRAILERLHAIAAKEDKESMVVTFNRHPLAVIAPGRRPLWAVPRSLTLEALSALTDHLEVIDFTPEIASLSAADFMKLLRDNYRVDTLIMGYDNSFGSDRPSSRQAYLDAAAQSGIRIEFVDALSSDDATPLSSSRLRKAIESWDTPLIVDLLGDLPTYEATVIRGRQLGRKLGFPTLNLMMPDDLTPLPQGVYTASLLGISPSPHATPDLLPHPLPALLSIGSNPTVNSQSEASYELHVPDAKLGDLYGHNLLFQPQQKIRDIHKFDSLDALRKAIADDIISLKNLSSSSL